MPVSIEWRPMKRRGSHSKCTKSWHGEMTKAPKHRASFCHFDAYSSESIAFVSVMAISGMMMNLYFHWHWITRRDDRPPYTPKCFAFTTQSVLNKIPFELLFSVDYRYKRIFDLIDDFRRAYARAFHFSMHMQADMYEERTYRRHFTCLYFDSTEKWHSHL